MSELRKQVIETLKVREFIQREGLETQYAYLVDKLETKGFLVEPYGKKINNELFEMRIRSPKQTRIIYFYHLNDLIIAVHSFTKKSQKTPKKELNQATKVMKQIKRGTYAE